MNAKKLLALFTAMVVLTMGVACQNVNDAPQIIDGNQYLPTTSAEADESIPSPPPESPSVDTSISGSSQSVTSSKSESQSQSKSESKEEEKPVKTSTVSSLEQTSSNISHTVEAPPNEVRSMWISYLELEKILTNKTQSEFTKNIAEQFDTCKNFGLNTVVVQVRPFGDAIYNSEYFPSSYLFNGKQGGIGEEPFDALQIMVTEARNRGLRIEAWINPYRVTKDRSWQIHNDNPAKTMLKTGDAVDYKDKITYNPASRMAQDLIVSGVYEIVKNYDIDAIHFDDYFYPTTDEDFDRDQYNLYKQSGGKKSLAQWRRNNVTTLMRSVNETIKKVNKNILFGISPQGNNDNNLNGQYVDVKELMEEGIIDYLCPQMYFGFNNKICPYSQTLQMFNDMAKKTGVKIYTGLATYKFGKVDTWAGENGKNEWVNSTDILARQVNDARQLSEYGGFILFRYDSTFNYKDFYAGNSSVYTQVETELKNLKNIL